MRQAALGLALIACAHTATSSATMSSTTLDHQDPAADTSHHEELSRSESRNWFERLLGRSQAPFTDLQTTSVPSPHDAQGCTGCQIDGDPSPPALLVLAGLAIGARRRRR